MEGFRWKSLFSILKSFAEAPFFARHKALGRGDMPAILSSTVHEVDCLYVGWPEDVPFAGRQYGYGELLELVASTGRTIDVLEFTLREIMVFDDRVRVLGP
jgi:hypothetical protein